MKSITSCCYSAAAVLLLLLCSSALPAGCNAEPQSPNSFPTADPLPNGYSTFALAPAGMKPPKVRKPPYLPLSLECPGLHDGTGLIARNNLCGDLNQGLIPRNPMGQSMLGQPYPFELLKNKTLQFLSRTLPYLKEEIESIPKVARFVKPSEFFEKNQSSRRYARQVATVAEPSGDASERSHLNGTVVANPTAKATANSPIPSGEGVPEVKEVNITKLSRQQLCEGNVLCQALESLKEDGLLSKSFLSNVVSAVGNVASSGSSTGGTGSTGALSSLLEQLTFPSSSADNSSKSGSSLTANRNKLATLMTLSQLLPSLTSSSSSSSPSDSNGTPMSGDGSPSSSSSSNAYSPLLSIIDYLQSLQSPKTTSSYYSGGATKRKSTLDQAPTEPEFMQSGAGPSDPSAQTPCASKEEYISPTYARNYQGVWKYVVQIPNEGYFTQTVQQTTCLKARCDLVEGGACRESPRWVSLLVAEIFYPNVYFPVNQLMPMLYQKQQQQQQQQQQQPSQASSYHHPQQLQASASSPQTNHLHQYQVLNSNHHSSQIKRQHFAGGAQSHRPGGQLQQQQHPQLNQLTKAELAALVNMLKRSDSGQQHQQQPSHPGLANVELLARRARVAKLEAESKAAPSSSEDALGDSASGETGASSSSNNKGGEAGSGQHCDGYDGKIGCYVVRVYYDWFLVNGSCKCWKATAGHGSGGGLNINETIKRIFIGKWKKK